MTESAHGCYPAPVPARISLNRDGLALVSGPEAYSFPTGPGTPTVRLSFVDAVRSRIGPAVPRWVGPGWPDPPPVLADAIRDLHSPCDW